MILVITRSGCIITKLSVILNEIEFNHNHPNIGRFYFFTLHKNNSIKGGTRSKYTSSVGKCLRVHKMEINLNSKNSY